VRNRAIFLFGFAKSERENISREELLTLRQIGADFLAADAAEITKSIEDGLLQKIQQ